MGYGGGKFVSDINVTPFVDVMLVLLIIFMVATPMMSTGLEVDLPQTSTAESLPGESDHMVLTIVRDGRVYLDEYAVEDLGTLQGYLQKLVKDKNKTLFLRADKEVPYGLVVEVMGQIKAAGIENLGVMADEGQGASAAKAAAATANPAASPVPANKEAPRK